MRKITPYAIVMFCFLGFLSAAAVFDVANAAETLVVNIDPQEAIDAGVTQVVFDRGGMRNRIAVAEG